MGWMTEKPSAITKVIYFVEAFFNARDYKRFGIEVLEKNGFDVEVWDFTPFIAPEEYQKANKPADFYCRNLRVFRTRKEARRALSQLDKHFFIMSLIHYSIKSLFIYRILYQKELKYCIDTMALPTVERSEDRVPRGVLDKLQVLKPSVFLSMVMNMIPYSVMGVNATDFILARGEKFNTPGVAVSNSSEVLWAHSYDYDIYLEERDRPTTVDASIGVFIDEYLPFHPDYAYMGNESPVMPDQYYPQICHFFDHIEREFGYKIIIAAHPRSRYEGLPDYFGGRPVIKDRTSELVRNSGFIIMHTSTAINFAVLYRKPIIIVTTDRYNEGWTEDPTPGWLAAYFGKKVHNLDRSIEFDPNREMTIDDAAYGSYRNAYIKKDGTEEISSWQILANRLKRINDDQYGG